MAGIRADISLSVNTANVKRSLDKATNEINRVIGKISGKQVSFNVNEKSFTQPLGTITASANEFTKSLEASNARVIAFGASVGIINGVSAAFKNLVLETIRFEKALSDINVVLGLSSESIQRFGEGIFDVAMNTAQSFNVAADAALEFSRQGLRTEEVLKRTNDALILTRLTSLNAADAVAGLTAAVNAFGDAGLTTTDIIDKLAAVDVKFAVSSEDLINGLQRAGAVAIDAGVELDSLVGLVAALQQTTARGGAVIGNSLKTIFTRIQRPESIRQIEDLGVAVRNIQGEVLSADRILLNMAKSFSTLTQAQQSNVVQFSAGIFQANVFRSILRDLAKEQSLHAQATEVSANASGEAAKKNEILNETLAALASQAGTGIQELAGIIGGLAVKPEIGGFLEFLVGQIEGVKKMLGGGEDEGSDFAKGLVRGIGNVLTGPAAIAFGAVFIKMFINIAKFASTSLKDVLGIVSQKDRIRQMEESIVQALSANKNLQESLNNLEGDRLAQEKFILGIIEAQTSAMREQQLLASRLAKPLARKGVTPDLTMKASGGLIPESVRSKEKRGARKGGYAPGSIDSMNIPGVGPVVFNKAETVKQFPGMKQPAIMPPKQSRAGSAYKNTFKEKHGFDPYASYGFVPNFAMKRGSALVMDKSPLKLFGSAMDIGKASGIKWTQVQEHIENKIPIALESSLQDIILSSEKNKKEISGKEKLFKTFNAISAAGVKSIRRDFDVRTIPKKGGRIKARETGPELAERKSTNILNAEQRLNKQQGIDSTKYIQTYDPLTKKGVQNYPVDILAMGAAFPSYEVKSGGFNPANLISKSLRMSSDRELEGWMKSQGISRQGLSQSNLSDATRLAGKLGIPGTGKEGEFTQGDADQWGMSKGLVPNFAGRPPKNWEPLYDDLIKKYKAGQIQSIQDIQDVLRVRSKGSLKNYINEEDNFGALKKALGEEKFDNLKKIYDQVKDKTGHLSDVRIKGDLFEEVFSMLAGQPFKKGTDALDFSEAKSRRIRVPRELRKKIGLQDSIVYGDTESGTGHGATLMRTKILRELAEQGKLGQILSQPGKKVELPGGRFVDIVARGTDARPKDSTTETLNDIRSKSKIKTRQAIDESIKNKNGTLSKIKLNKEISYDYHVDDVDLNKLTFQDINKHLSKQDADLIMRKTGRFSGLQSKYNNQGFIPNYNLQLGDKYFQKQEVQKALVRLYKNKTGKKLGRSDAEKAAERYTSLIKDSGRTYPGGDFMIGGKKFMANEVALSLMNRGQFYRPKEGETIENFSKGLIPNFRYWKKYVQFTKGTDGGWGIRGDTTHLHGLIDHLETSGGNSQKEIDKLKARLENTTNRRYKEIQDLGYAKMGREGANYYSKKRAISERPEVLSLKGVFLKNLKEAIHLYNDINNSRFSDGFVPNFSNPLVEAIERERAAGLPDSKIRIEKSAQLKSPLNPMGLAVTNTRDEPAGVQQGIRRSRSMGVDPRKHGASQGLIPNFAKGAAGVKNIKFKQGVSEEVKTEYLKSAEYLQSFNEKLNKATDEADQFSSGGLMKLFVFQSLLSTANGFLEQFAENGGKTAKAFAELGQATSNVTSTFLTTKEIGNQILEATNVKPGEEVRLGDLLRGGEARRGATKEITGGLKAAIDFKGVKNASGAISNFGKGLSTAGKGLFRFTPVLGTLITIGSAANEALKFFTGKGIFDLLKSDADRAADKLKELAEASEKTQNAIEGTSKLEQTNNKIKELSIKGSTKTNKEQIEFINLQTQRIKEETKLQQTISKLGSANKSNESIVRLINQAKTTEVTNTEKLNEILQKIALEEAIEQSITSVVKSFSKEIENLPNISTYATAIGFSPDKIKQAERRAEFKERQNAEQSAFNKVAIRIGDSLAGISMPEIKAEKIEDIKAGRFGEISGSAGEIFEDLSTRDQKKLQKLILKAIKNAEKDIKTKEEQAKSEKGAKDQFIKRLFLIKQGREQEALTLKLANKRNELYRKQNEFLDNILSEYGGINAAAKIEADAARKTAKIRSNYNEKLLEANQKALQGAEKALKEVFGEKSPETAEKLFGKVGDKDAKPVQFTEQEAANIGITKQQKKTANEILKEASKQKSSFSQLTVLYDELAKTKDEELHGAILRLISDRGLMDISQKQKNKIEEINTTLENKKATLEQDLQISLENIKQEKIKGLISKRTTEGAFELQNILSQGIPFAQTTIAEMEGNAATLKVLNNFRGDEVETILQSVALQAEATQLQKDKNRNDLIAVTKSAAQAKAQAEVFSKTEQYAQIIQKRLEQEISQSEIAARDAQLKNEFYNIESNRLALVKSQLQSEIDNLNTDNLIKQSRLELLTQYGKINELVAAQIQQSRLQATTDLATSIETAEQKGTPESMLDVAGKMSALNREMDTGSRAMDALRERLAEAQVNAANLGADLVNIGFDQAKSGLKQLFKDIGGGAKSASEAWESFGLSVASSLLDRIMEHNIDQMMSNLSVAFTGQDLLADANQRLASTIPTLDTSTNTLNTTTGSLNTTMGTLNGSVQQLTTTIGSINLNPGQPAVDVTIPTAPAQGPSTSVPVQKFLGGKIQAFNKGGFVEGEPGIDRVPAMLTAGEYVLNKEQVNKVQKQGASTLAKKPAELFMDSPKQISKNNVPQKTFEENVANKLQLFNGGVVKMLQEGGEANREIDKKVFDLEKRVVEKQQIQAIQKKEVLKVQQNPKQALPLNTAKVKKIASPEKALEGRKELLGIKKFQEGGVAERVKAGAQGAAQFAVMTGVSAALSKQINKKQDNPPPKFDMRKLENLDLGSDVNIKRGDPRLSARFIAEDPVMQEYRDHLLELATYRAQKTNEKFREKQGTLASVMGAVMSFAVSQLVAAATEPVQNSIQKGKNFLGKTMGQHKDQYSKALTIPGGKNLNYSQISKSIETGSPIKVKGRDWTYSGDSWVTNPTRPAALARQGGGSIPAMLTAGEGYVPASVAQRIGYTNLNKMNQTGSLPIINGPAGIDKVGPVGLNEGDFIIKKSSTDKLLRENPHMMKFALQNPEGFKRGERGYYEGGVVGTATRAAPSAPKTYKAQSAPEPRNRISSLIEEVDQTKAQESVQSTSNSITNNINVNVSIDKSGNESVSTEQTGSSLEKEKDLSMKIKAKVLEVIRDEKRIGGELS
jgi:TP901 family phage tail tape measure protein